MKQRMIAHVDMNSYFAGCEQQANPFLRGKPVGVCAYLHENGCVIAASIEAKRFGMKVGMTVRDAREAVPHAVFVQNDPAKYRSVTARIFEILHEISDVVEHYSIDEAFLDVTDICRNEAEAAFLLSRAKKRIQTEIGEWLTASIGIAPTRFLAKFGSDFQKPDGLVVVNKENLDDYLGRVELEALCGINKRMRRRFERLGIRTPLELKRYPPGNLVRMFGKAGYFWWCHLHGIPCEPTARETPQPKSIGHSYCVPNTVNEEGMVEAVLTKLTERAARRLRTRELFASYMHVTVGFREGEYDSEGYRFERPEQNSFLFHRVANQLLRELWRGEAVRFLAMTFTDLTIATRQLTMEVERNAAMLHPLQPSRWASERQYSVTASMDRIRDRYGDRAVVLGRMFDLQNKDHAPDRIGYRKTVSTQQITRHEPLTYEPI